MAKRQRSERAEQSLLTQGNLLNRMTNRIRQSLELQEILSATVAEVKSFLGPDRVKIYCFQPDGAGQVIAEATDLTSTRAKANREAVINQISTLLHSPIPIDEVL